MPRGDAKQVAGDRQSRRSGRRADEYAEECTQLSLDELVWFVGSICQLHAVSFDAGLLRKRTSAPCDREMLCELLAELGFDLKASEDLDPLHLAIAPVAFDPASEPTMVLVVRTTAQAVDFFRPLGATVTTLTPRDFALKRRGTLLTIRARSVAARDEDAVAAGRSFGFAWFIPELLKHRAIWRDVLLASLAIQLLALGLPLMTQAIIDKVIVHRTESTLIALGSGLAIFALFSAVLSWTRQYLVLHTGTRIDAVLGTSVFRHLVELPPRYFHSRPTGVIAARLHGVEQVREFLSSAAIALLLDLPFLSVCVAVMFLYSVPLALVAFAFLGLIVATSLVVSPLFQTRLNREFLLGARNQAFVTEYVAGIETVKSLQMEPTLLKRFGDYLAAHLAAGFATRQVANGYQVVAGTLEQAMALSILLAGAWIAMQPVAEGGAAFTIGMLVAFQMFANKLSQPLLRMVGLWQQFQQAHMAVRRLGDLMNAPAEPYVLVPNRGTQAEADCCARPIIQFESVSFRHADDRPYLYERLDLAIGKGECVALVGPSGCGKSTLAKLLQGFYLPTSGRILVDSIDTRHLAANELRAAFGIVPQETVLFSGTILENLLLAHPHATFEQVVHACRMAEIHATIEQLPQGYQTGIGERGAGLSGGQKQRLAIARALLRQPRVLIFDEATSHLDADTAAAFAATIASLRGVATILFITHAPIASLRFDRVIRL